MSLNSFIRKGNPCALVCYYCFPMNFIFGTYLRRSQNVLKCINQTTKADYKGNIMEDHSILGWMSISCN